MGGSSSKKSKSTTGKRKPRPEITEKDKAELDLKNSRDRLKRYQKRLDADLERLQGQAANLVKSGRKDRALLVLRLKKLKEKQNVQVDTQLMNVYQMIETISWETEQIKVLKALEAGKDALNELHSVMSVDAVEELLEESSEAIQVESEISRLLASNASGDPELADDAFEADLAALEAELNPQVDAGQDLADVANNLPEAPDTKPAVPDPVAAGATPAADAAEVAAQLPAVPGEAALDLPEAPTAAISVEQEAEPVLA